MPASGQLKVLAGGHDSEARVRIHDALLSRLSNDGDMENNFSTFASEMAASAMILGLASMLRLACMLTTAG
jgi:DNA mismatch repair ATPase MutS